VYLSDFDLQQLDEPKLTALPVEQKDALRVKLLWDLKDARERLKANSQSNSRPPSSDLPCHGNDLAGEALEAAGEGGDAVAPEAEVSTAKAATETERCDISVPAAGTTPAAEGAKWLHQTSSVASFPQSTAAPIGANERPRSKLRGILRCST
jgi:hypothetical protein